MPTGFYERKPISEQRRKERYSEEWKRKLSIAHKGKKPWNTGKKRAPFSQEWIDKIVKNLVPHQKGENNHFWKGGITPLNKKIRMSPEYKLWRVAVFTRDNYTCVLCGTKFIKGQTGKVLFHADHIKRFAEHPELRFSVDNGRTLCVPCHKETDTYGNKNKKINK